MIENIGRCGMDDSAGGDNDQENIVMMVDDEGEEVCH